MAEGNGKAASEGMVFDVTIQTIPVIIGGTEYELREANGDTAARWRNAILKQTTINPETGKPSSVGQIADTESFLVALCLFEKSNGKPVSQIQVKKWPSRVVKQLFDKVQEISDLKEDDDTEERAKNELSDTMDG